MSLSSKLGTDASEWNDPERANRLVPIGAGVGGAVGAVVGSTVAGATAEAAVLAGAGAAAAVPVTWLVLATLD